MMKRLIKLIFVFVLIGSTMSILPAYATDAENTPTKEPQEIPETSETSESEPTEPAEKPGETWSGEIAEPANNPIQKPTEKTVVIVKETTAPATTTPSTTKKSIPVEVSPSPVAEPEPTAIEEAAEPEIITTETTETDEEEQIYVPKTLAPSDYKKRVKKITLMSLISTAILFFAVMSIFFAIKAHQFAPNNETDKKEDRAKKSKKTDKSEKSHKAKKDKKDKTPKKPAKDVNPLLLPHSH